MTSKSMAKVSEKDLKQILAEHKKWAVSAGREGARAYLGGADLRGWDLRGEYLGGAYLRDVNLRGTDLRGTDLGGAYLLGADLRGANLLCSYLRYVYLGGADLGGTDLRGTDLGGVYLGGADLRGANLRDAKDCIEVPVGDPRGYRCVAIRYSYEWRVFAGCRGPLSLEEGEQHWGADYEGGRDIGDRYLHGLKWLREKLEAQEVRS